MGGGLVWFVAARLSFKTSLSALVGSCRYGENLLHQKLLVMFPASPSPLAGTRSTAPRPAVAEAVCAPRIQSLAVLHHKLIIMAPEVIAGSYRSERMLRAIVVHPSAPAACTPRMHSLADYKSLGLSQRTNVASNCSALHTPELQCTTHTMMFSTAGHHGAAVIVESYGSMGAVSCRSWLHRPQTAHLHHSKNSATRCVRNS